MILLYEETKKKKKRKRKRKKENNNVLSLEINLFSREITSFVS